MVDYSIALGDLPDPLPIAPLSGPFNAAIVPPGSKSITCRAYVLAALSSGESRIRCPLRADDTDRLLAALGTLGAAATWRDGDVIIKGVGGRFPKGGSVDLGDGGAPARFTLAAACLASAAVTIDGSPRLRERPVAELVELLRRSGADVGYAGDEDRLPVVVRPGKDFRGGRLRVATTLSSQFISAVMLTAPWLEGGLELRFDDPVTSESYVKLTAETLRLWGAAVEARPGRLTIAPGGLSGKDFTVPPDASSAVYWWTAEALIPGSKLCLPFMIDEPPAQPDSQYLASVLPALAAGAAEIDMSQMPDAAMSLAVLAAMGNRPLTITGLQTLRVKESDRIAALAAELAKLGCGAVPGPDRLTIDPRSRHPHAAVIDTYNDHRMAMAFAVLGLARPGISVRNPSCVAKSYPTYWKDLGVLSS